jgi:CheY-like chemotaxis protein
MSRILIVDNEKMCADATAMILTTVGHECRVSYDGPQSLALATDWKPHLVISELVMPGFNGIKLYHHLRTLPNQPALLLVSGSQFASVIVEDEKRHGHHLDLLTKPVDPHTLIATVSMMISRCEHKDDLAH